MADNNNVIELNTEMNALMKSMDPNEGSRVGGAKLPSAEFAAAHIGDGLGAYMALADRVLQGSAPKGTLLERAMIDYQKAIDQSWEDYVRKSADVTAKAVDVPGQFLSFARMSYMPDSTSSNIMPWPGLHPEAIRKIIMENLAPNLIINTRVDDVLNYSQHSAQLWKRGWRIETFQGDKTPSAQDKKDILEAQQFLFSSATKLSYVQALDREERNLPDFMHFLGAIVRDTLSFDMIAVSTDRDAGGRVVEYAPVPAGNIRLVGLRGYEGNTDIFAVAVDEGGAIKRTYTRRELIIYIRNIRTDPEHSITMTRAYGTPEITTAMKLIQIFQNVIDFNSDVFNRSGVPHGLLKLTGNGWTQKQVDVLTRMWHNLKRGITKALALPVVAAPKDGDIEVVDFSRIKGDEALYQDLLNLSIGCFGAVFRFPAHRLGYRVSGHGPDTNMNMGSKQHTAHQIAQEDDLGLTALLLHIENFINQNFIWPRWAGLKFAFTGKNPKEDAREFESRKNAQTWGEARGESDLIELEKLKSVKGDADLEKLAKLMDMAPIDPNLSGIFQTLAAAVLAPKPDQEVTGNTMSSSKDPASSESHGKVSGVRRDSKTEGRSAN